MERIFRVDLGWPPSVNHYWKRTRGGGVMLSDKGKAYKEHVYARVIRAYGSLPKPVILRGDLVCYTLLMPPTKRRVDLDNRNKAIFDALGHAHAFEDDSQIKMHVNRFGSVRKDGAVRVILREFHHSTEAADRWFESL